jgi:transcription initiation factor TFIID subunit TAF12
VLIRVTQILGDVLDSFMMEGVRGSIGLAKHRKSKQIEVKDVAFFLGVQAILHLIRCFELISLI